MKTLVLSAAILALAATAWAEEAKTDSVKGPETPVIRRLPPPDRAKLKTQEALGGWGLWRWEPKELDDEKNGVVVRIRVVPAWVSREPPREHTTRRRVYFESGVKWMEEEDVIGANSLTIRLRLTPETVRNLVTNSEAPLFPRCIAVREIGEVEGFSRDERLKMIELASRDVQQPIRLMAVSAAAQHEPLTEGIPILSRALCDPSDEVACDACAHICRFFNLSDRLRLMDHYAINNWHDPAAIERYLRRFRRYVVLLVAKDVHGLYPDLVTASDVAMIDSMFDVPSGNRQAAPNVKSPEKPDAKSP